MKSKSASINVLVGAWKNATSCARETESAPDLAPSPPTIPRRADLVDKRLAKVGNLDLPTRALLERIRPALSKHKRDPLGLLFALLLPLFGDGLGDVEIGVGEGGNELGEEEVVLEVRRDEVLDGWERLEGFKRRGVERVGGDEPSGVVLERDGGLVGVTRQERLTEVGRR